MALRFPVGALVEAIGVRLSFSLKAHCSRGGRAYIYCSNPGRDRAQDSITWRCPAYKGK
ncbi:hypothetical protein RvY_09212 [Ramazzottius varieornatus]|uniref:Uncharacterized protein n=1 Tax=Ramazzottius varieornatus TaxID=947166 RepID=A0A1D1VHP8_RAMVA|nr:hypothetical protein RvY_09212 [Ramazzottius varieornatus]